MPWSWSRTLTVGCGADLLINLILWFLGWIPGVIHGWYIISKYQEPAVRY
jgi:uncharacterized membrane protein YqaE (UPF0057 family)